MKELKPCPFCGGEAVAWITNRYPYGVATNYYHSTDHGYIECSRCHIRTAEHKQMSYATAKWNRRCGDE